jgi:type IV pilus assembly protein PilP
MIDRAINIAGSTLVSILLLGVLVGCANPHMDQLERYVAEKKAEPGGRIAPLPEIKQITTFVYEANGRRDPFMPTADGQREEAGNVENGISPDFNRRKEELEGYSLDSIRMVGTLAQAGVTWGLVKTKEGTIHRVKTGNYMGENHGRITEITEDKIDLTEIVQNGSGGYIERQASLALAE